MALLGIVVFATLWWAAPAEMTPVQYRLLALLGGGLLLLAWLWPYVRAFGRKTDVMIYSVLLLTFLASWKAWDIVEHAFAQRMGSPELSHVVVEVSNSRHFTEYAMHQLDRKLLRAGFMPPPPSPAPRVRSRFPRAFFYGRHVLDVELFEGKATPDSRVECHNTRLDSVDMLALSLDEPLVSRLRHFTGKVTPEGVEKLQPVAFKPLERGKSKAGVYNAYVSMRLLRRLARQSGKEMGIGSTFCVDVLGDHKPVRIAGIIDRLPEGVRGRQYELMVNVDIASHRCRNKKYRCFLLAAAYIDHNRVEEFMEHMERWSTEGVRVRPTPRTRSRVLRFNLGDAFTKIRDSLALASVFGSAAIGAVAAIIFLVATLTGINAHMNILQNERSLCVMRAFGIGTVRIFGMLLLQFAVVLALPLLLAILLSHFVWPAVVPGVATATQLSPGTVSFDWLQTMVILGIFALIVILGCLMATVYWWWSSRWIAQRLKEIG